MNMTTQERYDDICRISGMSEEIVRRVLNAEKESILNSLKRGERATIIGRCVLRPQIDTKITIGGERVNYIKVKSDVAPALKAQLEEMTGFEKDREVEEIEGIKLNQIPALV